MRGVSRHRLARMFGEKKPSREGFSISAELKKNFASHDLERYERELLILVDENDKEIGYDNIVKCHMTEFVEKEQLLHRAFSVLMFDSEFNLLMQRRALTKPIFPGWWANSCCSHPQKTIAGEDEVKESLGVRKAAARRVQQELGIQLKKEDFTALAILQYRAKYNQTFSEHESDHLVACQVFKKHQIRPNPNEVSSLEWVSRANVKEFMANKENTGELVAPWFKHMIEIGLLDWWAKFEQSQKIVAPFEQQGLKIFRV